MKTPKKETHNRILIVIHHLAVDGVSWRILLDDLDLLLTGIQKKETVDLGFKTSSYRQWYETLEEYGRSKRLLSQRQFWEKAVSSFKPLVTDKKYKGTVKAKDIKSHQIRLDTDNTQMLLKEVPRAYHTEINDILLCALAMTICEKDSVENITIDLEGHGRENISEGIDTSRTMGWFTSFYPVLLELSEDRNISNVIKSVKEQLRSIPDKGLGYGVLKYINKDERLAGKDRVDIVFNYLGQLDNVVSKDKWLSAAEESSGSSLSDDQPVNYKLSVNGMIQGSELILNWGYSSLHFEKETIGKLSERYKTNLESLITHCIEQQKSGVIYTPSDFGLGTEISYK
jgi:non-ribosomal peptide synthase protein (TIGR01720 family)